ncbi:virulence associated lipoprotein [Borreliella garinii]|uniref:virulence associated lipoprotein n=1 Tax=Borreliella garinii TaxID=29519 RepID=UPI00018ACFC9|nr:virulence associated lipoprotein [Borreliella garinii]ACL35152.1 virulent strain associated lipoprotein [Borreliella garinii Far04]WNZ67178.1 virulence associated lipoprotein [Borreliella garinii]WNZ68176.1 virulence associated lipoprotein [Borreliella garinii]WNZ69176.1 virulence associated lipoprotein [Borreliella garinii]WNZ70177.1 virulence associated lipoprotein [Borreliella garinii]
MKYNIIVSMFVFLFLTACNPDFNTNQKDVKHQSSRKRVKSNQKRLKSNQKGLKPKTEVDQNQEANQNQEADQNKITKNTLLDNLRNLIEKVNKDRKKYVQRLEEEPLNQYGILAFKELFWEGTQDKAADNIEKAKIYRQRTYSVLNDFDTNEFKKFSAITMLSKQQQGLFNSFNSFGATIEDTFVFLLNPNKKDNLEKLEISDLENLKNSIEKFLSIKTMISTILTQFLLDYESNKNFIKTDTSKLDFYLATISNQIEEQNAEAIKLKNDIFSIENFKSY